MIYLIFLSLGPEVLTVFDIFSFRFFRCFPMKKYVFFDFFHILTEALSLASIFPSTVGGAGPPWGPIKPPVSPAAPSLQSWALQPYLTLPVPYLTCPCGTRYFWPYNQIFIVFLVKFWAPGGALGPHRAPKMGPGVVYKNFIKIPGISIWNSLSPVGANCKSHFCFSFFMNVPIFLDRFL